MAAAVSAVEGVASRSPSCALCLPSLDNGFHCDDSHAIALNPHIRSLSEAGSLFRDFQTFSANPASATFRPVLMLSALNYAVAGEAPAGSHAVNPLLHGLNAVLLFWALLAVWIGPCWNPCALSMCSCGHNSKPRFITSRCSPCP